MNQTEDNGNDTIGFATQVKKVLLAGVGAMVLAQEEIEDFVGRLVKKGEMAEKDGRRLVSEILSRRKQDVLRGMEEMEGDWSQSVGWVLHKMNLASKGDIGALEKRIEDLSRKLEKLTPAERRQATQK